MRQIAYGQDALFEFPLLTPATSDFMTAFPVAIAAGDVKVSTDTALDANPGAYILSFDSMDALPSRGDAITENGGDGAATVMFVIIVSGTVGAGTAAGFMFVKGVSGTWTDNSTIDNTTTSDTDFGTVDTGVQVWTTNAAATAGLFAWANNKCYVALTAAETACGQGTVLVKDATATELWIDTGEAFTTVREDDGIVCRCYFKSDSNTTGFTLQRVLQGALTNVQVGDILKPVGIPARIIKTFASGTGVGTVDAFISSPASLQCIVFGSAPKDAAADFSTTEKASLDTAADSVLLANGAHGGAAATLTLLSGVINNSGGVGLSITGSTTGMGIHGASIGLDVDASAGPAVDVDGTTFGLDIAASAGDGIKSVGTGGIDLNADMTGDVTGTVATVTTVTNQLTAAAIAAGLLDLADGVETGLTLRNLLRDAAAVLLGETTGGATAAPVFKSLDISGGVVQSTKSRVTGASGDSSGNRGKPVLDHS